jgi:glycosyltransferase involved in cell wall biosynthesis
LHNLNALPVHNNIRILQVHNRHAPGWGGEETVVDLEAQLLEKWGHPVEQFYISNESLKQASHIHQMLTVPRLFWSQSDYQKLRQVIARFAPDIVHVHNTFPLFSPSVFWAAHSANIPVVNTLHNFRHACANTILLRNDKPCEACVGGSVWPGLRHRCYSNSFIRTAAVVGMNKFHWEIGTYTRKIDAFIALSNFSRDIFVRAGLPRKKMFVKPNFVPTSMPGESVRAPQVVFAGSMMRHKGLHVLLDAWQRIKVDGGQLLLIGDGPERESLQKQFHSVLGVSWCGSMKHKEVLNCIRKSRVLVLPTLVYENCPMVLLEAFSVGTPVIVPSLGSMKTMVRHQMEGLTYLAGDPGALAGVLQQALCASSGVWSKWSAEAQQAHARSYSENTNYEQLISIYRHVMEKHAHSKDHMSNQIELTVLENTSRSIVHSKGD